MPLRQDLFIRQRRGTRLTSHVTRHEGLRTASIKVRGPLIYNYDLEAQFDLVLESIRQKMRDGHLDRFYRRWASSYASVQFNMSVHLWKKDGGDRDAFTHSAPTSVQEPPPSFDQFVDFGVRDYFKQLRKAKYFRKALPLEITVRFMSLRHR